MAKTIQDFNKDDEELCKEANKFVSVYYDVLDRKREKISFLYANVANSNLVWNGNPVDGYDNICKFMTTIPATRHEIHSIDAQRFPENMNGELFNGIILHVAGAVSSGDDGDRAFTQTLVLCVEDEKYRIKSDRFRYIE
ncbi:unnamed protein product [Caenorhabditis angaria]|uniref:NTF2-related export protein n=1 Tax=Caenorhabditis angaria TaxID=860376 RepID=A0A9P1I4E7_9PELO|nr:unnamed protein product [Caenorhabditis angaria]